MPPEIPRGSFLIFGVQTSNFPDFPSQAGEIQSGYITKGKRLPPEGRGRTRFATIFSGDTSDSHGRTSWRPEVASCVAFAGKFSTG